MRLIKHGVLVQSLTSGIKEATDPGRQRELLSSARLALRIFFSMNNPGLTEVRTYQGLEFRAWSTIMVECRRLC